jgi:hypothetical protein
MHWLIAHVLLSHNVADSLIGEHLLLLRRAQALSGPMRHVHLFVVPIYLCPAPLAPRLGSQGQQD